MKEYTIALRNDSPFWLGDRFFKVDPSPGKSYYDGERSYQAKCPACNDSRKLRALGCDGNEYETECPVCKNSSGHTGYGTTIHLNHWTVHEYIVNRVDASGDTVVSAYKNGSCVMNSVSLYAFCRVGRCSDEYITTSAPAYSHHGVDPIVDKRFAEEYVNNRTFSHVFRKKKDAELLCAMLKELDRQRLAEFNETYGTNHTYPF